MESLPESVHAAAAAGTALVAAVLPPGNIKLKAEKTISLEIAYFVPVDWMTI